MAHPGDRLAHLARRGHDFHRQVDDVGIGPQLLDRRHAIGVDRDQPDAPLLAQPIVGRQLGDRRRLADARRTDQRHHAALVASTS